jgi:hypothetical protein
MSNFYIYKDQFVDEQIKLIIKFLFQETSSKKLFV